MSSASSSSSLHSVFDRSESRSATPSSVGSDAPSRTSPCFPKTYVYFPLSSIEHNVAKAIFDAYAQQGCLGLCLASINKQQDASMPEFAEWEKRQIITESQSIDVFVSVLGSLTIDVDELNTCMSVTRTNPRAAEHFLAFSTASLRAVVSVPIIGDCVLYVVEQPPFVFPALSRTPGFQVTPTKSYGNIPTLEEWNTVWSTWDFITLRMIPQEMLHQKPIDLRHKCLFYIGHIPTFLDMLLSKAIGGGASEPKYFWNIFERGIDPHVDDPDHCHNHSDIPEADEDWPTLETIIAFRDRVRARLALLYDDLQTGKRHLTRNIARTLVMTLEHEGFHIETLLYMLIQRAGSGTLPPPGFVTPPWELLTQQWEANPPPVSSTITLGPASVFLGHADCEGDDFQEDIAENVDGHVFGWDNESPERRYEVKAFRADWRPVSNGDYKAFWQNNGGSPSGMPGSWVEEDGDIKVRTMYGPVSMEIAQHWPALTSYDQLYAYARSKGGRLPTEPELRLFLDTYEVGHEGGANAGFRNWHPVPATTGTENNSGKGSNGGIWEWTSTPFETHEGLSPTNLFVGYSTDFFDKKHQIALGASYATIPRLASRRTVRNFYQHNYPYSWVGGRVVYDL